MLRDYLPRFLGSGPVFSSYPIAGTRPSVSRRRRAMTNRLESGGFSLSTGVVAVWTADYGREILCKWRLGLQRHCHLLVQQNGRGRSLEGCAMRVELAGAIEIA